MIIKAYLGGQEREFETLGVVTLEPVGATHYVSNRGHIHATHGGPYCVTLFLRLISPRHTFGGVVFEEEQHKQGETLGHGEWGISTGDPTDPVDEYPYLHYGDEVMVKDFVILRPVALEV